jgi:Outer membrane protein beta-barrel domain
MRKLLAALFGLLIVAAPVGAQDRPVSINFGAGVLMPVSGLNDVFDTGASGGIGATFNVSPTFGIQAEYMYNWMGGPERTITIFPTPGDPNGSKQLLESNHNMHTVTFNGVYTAPRGDGVVGGYGLGGLGVYHRSVEVTSPAVGYTYVCDPYYWYWCYPALVEVDRILVERSQTNFGINFGGGVTFGGESAKFYVELRYHYVWGDDVQLPAGECQQEACSTNASYFPITFGVRW